VPAVVIQGRSAPARSMKICVQPAGAAVPAGHRVTLTPSWTPWALRLKLMLRSASSVVPAEVISTSASSSPSVVRPAAGPRRPRRVPPERWQVRVSYALSSPSEVMEDVAITFPESL
jgi:hypothetical protein